MTVPVLAVGDLFTAAVEDTMAGILNQLLVYRVQATSFGTDLVSAGATEVVGYSQAVALTNGKRYRVTVRAFCSAATAGNTAELRVRYDTAAVTNTSTLADVGIRVVHSAAGGPGQFSEHFWVEFVAPSTATYNIAVGVATNSGTGNETIFGTAKATLITIEGVGV